MKASLADTFIIAGMGLPGIEVNTEIMNVAHVDLRALERETHFCPGLAIEPVSHRRKDRNSCDLSFRFHECWSSGSAASDGSNSVSIFGAGWTRTKYSRPISSCRIGSGNISASRAYCERCAAIAAIFCWT